MRLQHDRFHTSLDHAIPELVQPRQRRSHITRIPVRERRACPEDLGGAGCAGPDDGIEVLGRGLLGPKEVLA